MDTTFNAPLADEAPQQRILPLYGGAEKPVEEMTLEEFDTAAKQVLQKVREAAFSRGLPIIVSRNGQSIREFADGHIELIA